MADGQVIARAYVEIIPSMQGSQRTIASDLGAVVEPASKEAGEKSGKSFGESLAKGLKTTAAVITGAMAAATAGAVASAKAFINTAKATADYGDTVDKTSQKLGLSNKAYQEWDYVMKICGTEMSSMTTGLKTLTNKLDDAKNGSESAQAMFGALGISMEDIKNLSREDLFEKTIAGLQSMEDSTDRAALANDLFGKSGQNLAPLFNLTAEETQGLIDKANELGMVMTDEGVKASASYKDALTTLDGTMTGLKNNIMTQFMPGLSKATEGLAEALGGKGTGKLTDGINLLMKELKRMAPVALKLVSSLGTSLIQGIGPLLPDLVSTIFTLLISAITTVTSMIPEMMPSIIAGLEGIMSALLNALPVIISGLTTLVMSIVSWLASGDNVSNFVHGLIDMVVQIVNSISMILPVLLPAIVTVISEVCKALTEPSTIKMLIDAALTLIGAIAVAIWNSLPEIWKGIWGILKNWGNLLGDAIYWTVNLFKTTFSSIVSTVKGWGENILGFFTGLWTKVTDGAKKGLENLKSKFTSVIDNIRNTVKNGIEKIKSFFNFNWSLPKIKLPHFTISGSFSINPPKVPTFKISWYAKAMDEPYMLNNATIFGAMGGKLLGGGEKGSELVVGTERLMSMIREASVGSRPITINVYGAEGQNVNDLANIVADRLGDMTRRKEVVYA